VVGGGREGLVGQWQLPGCERIGGGGSANGVRTLSLADPDLPAGGGQPGESESEGVGVGEYHSPVRTMKARWRTTTPWILGARPRKLQASAKQKPARRGQREL